MSKRILVVEDEFSIQRILQYDLTQSGFLVDLASDGEEGLKKALVNDYDVILLDIMLPKKDGFAVCKELRAQIFQRTSSCFQHVMMNWTVYQDLILEQMII